MAQSPLRNPNAELSPFQTKAYRLTGEEEARLLDDNADKTFADGEKANAASDRYVNANVILASAMFFAGIAQTFQLQQVRLVLGGISIFACVFGFMRLIALPAL